MNSKPLKGWLKHGDFIIIDLICLQVSFILAYFIRTGMTNPYLLETDGHLGDILIMSQLATIVFLNNYKGIIRRGKLEELIAVGRFAAVMTITALAVLFVIHTTTSVSRLQFGLTMEVYILIDYVVRLLNKAWIRRKSANIENKLGRSMVVMTTGDKIDEAIENLTGMYRNYFITAAVVTDGKTDRVNNPKNIPLFSLNKQMEERLRSGWVDEVFILQAKEVSVSEEFVNNLIDMGITVHFCPEVFNDENWASVEVQKLGRYKVLTSSLRFVPKEKLMIKRAMDIAGGVVGCIITGILFIFVAPAIYIKSPGPIFFRQERIGKNGRPFMIYKFRSMYMDADERKAALMGKNKITDDLMFKLEDDPRIIGSEKKDSMGRPIGIGNFIRNTSIDEFPQFWNVLTGTMSLVGTRPPLRSEWERYSPHHRARMTVKPGITGLWQVSGRSNIVDFEEVVRLDKEYIENWSLKGDLKIILKTVVVLFSGDGAR